MTSKLLLTLLIAGAAGPDAVTLARTFTEGKTATYQVSAVDKSRDMKLESKLTLSVSGKTADGKTPVGVKSPSVTMSIGGNVASEDPIELKMNFDSHGMPLELTVQNGDAAVAMLAIAGYLPGTDVEVGKSFPIEWQQGEIRLNGSGSLEKVEEKDGRKVATVKIKAELTPGSETPGVIETLSTIDLADGSLVESNGKVTIENEGEFVLTVKKVEK